MAKKKSYHHGNLRAALLIASVDVLAQEGVEALSLRKVTQRVGVSHAAVYRHFESKEALLAAVAQEGFDRLHQVLTEAMMDKEPLARFEAIGVSYIKFAAEHPEEFRVMFGHSVQDKSQYPGLLTAYERTLQPMLDCIKQCQEVGDIREGSPMHLATLAWSAVHGQATLLIDHQLPMLLKEHKNVDTLALRLASSLYKGFAPDLSVAENRLTAD